MSNKKTGYVTCPYCGYADLQTECSDQESDGGIMSETERKIIAWLLSSDTGTSSKTMLIAMTGVEPMPTDTLTFYPDMPYDPADFARCHRLLKLFPEWIPMLGKVSEKFPRWKKIIDNWDDLTRMYEAKSYSNLFHELQKLGWEEVDK